MSFQFFTFVDIRECRPLRYRFIFFSIDVDRDACSRPPIHMPLFSPSQMRFSSVIQALSSTPTCRVHPPAFDVQSSLSLMPCLFSATFACPSYRLRLLRYFRRRHAVFFTSSRRLSAFFRASSRVALLFTFPSSFFFIVFSLRDIAFCLFFMLSALSFARYLFLLPEKLQLAFAISQLILIRY